MQWHTAPVNQGQIVTVSYGWLGGAVLRRTYDASDRTETIRYLADPWGETEDSDEAEELEAWRPWDQDAPEWLDRALDEAPEIDADRLERLEADQ